MRRRAAHAFRFAILDSSALTSRALSFWRELAGQALLFGGGCGVVVATIAYLVWLLVADSNRPLPTDVIWLIRGIGMLLTAGLVFPLISFAGVRRYNGEVVSVSEVLGVAKESFQSIVVGSMWLTLLSVAVLSPMLLLELADSDGMQALVVLIGIPAAVTIYCLVVSRKGLAPTIAVLEECEFGEASKRSSFLTQSARGQLLGLMLKMALVSQLLALPFTVIKVTLTAWLEPTAQVEIALELVLMLGWCTSVCVTAHALTLFYLSQRCAWEGLDISSIAVAFHTEIEREALERFIREGYYPPGKTPADVVHVVYRNLVVEPQGSNVSPNLRPHGLLRTGGRKW